jgi:iron-sulfur cluster assembly accessory protein
MVTVTDLAVEKIKALLQEQGNPGYGVRMGILGGGCSGFQYKMDFEEQAGDLDQVIEDNGVRLFVDAKSCLYLSGATLDYQDGLLGAGFKIDNPNARSTCGCGESFTI